MWSDTTDIRLTILENLPELSVRDDIVGWIRGETLPPSPTSRIRGAKNYFRDVSR
jgi:hypothetical protein